MTLYYSYYLTSKYTAIMGKIRGGQLSGVAGNMVIYNFNDTEYFRVVPGWCVRKNICDIVIEVGRR